MWQTFSQRAITLLMSVAIFSARQQSQSCNRRSHSTPHPHFLKIHFNIIPQPKLSSPSGYFPSFLSDQNFVWTPHLCIWSTHHILLYFISRVLPEKLTVRQLVSKFPAFYVNRRFITVFTTAHHLSLSAAVPTQNYATPRHIMLFEIHFNTILSTSRSSKCFFLTGLPIKTWYTFLFYPG
jgi:hypothetical protein